MYLLSGAGRATPCVQCARALRLRLMSMRGAPRVVAAPFSVAARSASSITCARTLKVRPHTRLLSQSTHLAAKRRSRDDDETVNPADLPDADFDPTIEELLRGPDEEVDEGQYEQMGDEAPTTGKPTGKPQPTPSVPSFYSLFPKTLPHGPPPAGPFAIDTRALHREFLQLQAAAHPDLHHAVAGEKANKTGGKARAEALSSLINEAYRTLASPLSRAQYLLQSQYGIDLAGDEGTLAGGPSEANLLMEVMEVREQIEWAAREEELAPIRRANDARMRESEAVLAAAFAAGDAATARHEAMRLRYWVNVDAALKNWGEAAGAYFDHH